MIRSSSITTTETLPPVAKDVPPMKIVWLNVFIFAYLHTGAIYGAYLAYSSAMWQTNAFASFLFLICHLGITAGAHRLWTHRSYKARLPLRILLTIFNSSTYQNSIYIWSRDHRVHHKYSETNADPHNATRGFFFSHVGWLLVKKHPEVKDKGKTIDLSDLKADPIVRFQHRFYYPIVLVFTVILPTTIPNWLWGDSYWNAYFVAGILRYILHLNTTWLVNSAAHMWGSRPYDRLISPRENLLVSFGAIGEGFHNYHHTFPYDYSTSEYGMKLNLTTMFIDFMAAIGQAYDRKSVPKDIIQARKNRTGEIHSKDF